MTLLAQFECRICWTIYDPAIGDDVAQIEPGTPFTELPEDWCCPVCEAPKAQFLLIDTSHADA
ncbi:MAG TPA: rubredoxin [Acidocella sp.]|jgi:rubredoxin|nr:rubredoxin [Acidocella sp.]OYV24884.1 MAG: rubredoxin [Rhodospirillales bacterium 20-58-10]HQT37935.1 rubredoxin [Acidocella sp.]